MTKYDHLKIIWLSVLEVGIVSSFITSEHDVYEMQLARTKGVF